MTTEHANATETEETQRIVDSIVFVNKLSHCEHIRWWMVRNYSMQIRQNIAYYIYKSLLP